jgi:hypothetical protein
MFKLCSVVRCEEEDEIMGKTWREVKAITGNRVCGCLWRPCMVKWSNRKLTLLALT